MRWAGELKHALALFLNAACRLMISIAFVDYFQGQHVDAVLDSFKRWLAATDVSQQEEILEEPPDLSDYPNVLQMVKQAGATPCNGMRVTYIARMYLCRSVYILRGPRSAGSRFYHPPVDPARL